MDHPNRAAEAGQSFEKMEQAWEETQGEVSGPLYPKLSTCLRAPG